MTYALFLGCIAPLRYPDIEKATRISLKNLGIEIKDMEGATCCPAGASFNCIDEITSLAISARNLSIAEEMKCDVVTICSGCFSTLKEANKKLRENNEKRKLVNEVLGEIGRAYKGKTEIKHLVELLYDDVGIERIRDSIKRPLNGIKIAPHYGCHILRPSIFLDVDNPEKPRKLDELINALGAKSLSYQHKLMCCGAGGGLRAYDHNFATRIVTRKLNAIKEAGAHAIVDVCPFCHLQFDVSQAELNEKKGYEFKIPVFHYTQLLALAQGNDPKEIISVSKIPRENIINKIKVEAK
ncbi:MAG: CoB--CoM heterodisulfide reductase subunit B [Candidatus Hydrothermarchaeota archaeon]